MGKCYLYLYLKESKEKMEMEKYQENVGKLLKKLKKD